MEGNTNDIKVLDLRFSWVFNFVLSPFDLRELVNSFSKRGYATLSELPPIPFRGRLGGAGIIAKKDKFDVFVDTDRQIIGIKGIVGFSEFNPIIQELKNILKEDFDIDVSQNLRYCELLATLRVRREGAINKIRSVSVVREVPELKDLVGEYSLVGLRIGSNATLPTQSNWFDIEVHPTWTNPNKFFDVNIVYRNELEGNVINFARNLEKVVLYALKVLF